MSTADVEILVIVPVSDETLSRIAAIDPRVRVVDARGWFDVEIRETWPPRTVQRYLGQRAVQVSSREQRDRLLAGAEVVLAGWPPLLDLRARAPRLRWLHQLPAGASNLLRADLWGSDVTVTTSRGYGNTRAMAEYVLACFYNFTRDSIMRTAIGGIITSTMAATVRSYWRAKPHVSSARAVSAGTWAGYARAWGCA